jgi:hypothetical protein
MPVNKTQIKELLGSGLNAETVASAVGCEVSYISQLLSDEQFASDVSSLRTVALTAYSRRDETINGMEDKIISKLAAIIEDDGFYKPKDLLAAFAIVNKAQRRGSPLTHTGNTITNIVQLSLPTQIVKQFTTNRMNEVIEVEGQTMVTMPAHSLLRKLASEASEKGLDNEQANKYREAAKFLPGAQPSAREVFNDIDI